ncbi:hypothetical protein SDC9_102816 [bioreactor metagenome]|uniref:Uncharacterized protein n=1 Tax=bioreactor metagenome TaxID=1076179 RepID=A0A645ATC9_9ZZZZ
MGTGEVHHKTAVTDHLNVVVLLQDLTEHLHSLIRGEQALLLHIVSHHHIELLIQLGAAFNDIDMAIGGRIERSGQHGRPFTCNHCLIPSTYFFIASRASPFSHTIRFTKVKVPSSFISTIAKVPRPM